MHRIPSRPESIQQYNQLPGLNMLYMCIEFTNSLRVCGLRHARGSPCKVRNSTSEPIYTKVFRRLQDIRAWSSCTELLTLTVALTGSTESVDFESLSPCRIVDRRHCTKYVPARCAQLPWKYNRIDRSYASYTLQWRFVHGRIISVSSRAFDTGSRSPRINR